MKRRLFALFLVPLLLLILIPQLTLPASAEKDGLYTYTVTDGKATVTAIDVSAAVGDITVPDTLGGYPVSALGMDCFYSCTELTGVTLPNSVIHIYSYAFSRCDKLVQLNLGSSLVSIGDNAFEDCAKLKGLTLPDSLQTIGEQAFKSCSELKELTLPNAVTAIGEKAFDGSGLEHITLGNSLSAISDSTFSGAANLLDLTIPDGIASIGEYAFENCNSLKSIILPDSLTTIENGAFFGCVALEGVELPEGLMSAGTDTFSGCRSLETITLPDSLTEIGWSMFEGCTSLTDVTLGRGITLIGWCAFKDCSSLTALLLPKQVTGIEDTAFEGCKALTDITIENCAKMNISETAFDGCNPLKLLCYSDCDAEAFGKAQGWTLSYLQDFPFTDVFKNKWYFTAVRFAYLQNLFAGTSETTFGPDENMTRAMLVTVLWRLGGEPTAEKTTSFSDVPAEQWYTNAVSWAAENDIVSGIGENRFDPEGNVTREQIAAVMFRYTGFMGYSTAGNADLSAFPDSNVVSNWAKDAFSWANAEGLISGSSMGGTAYLDPQGNATRSQVAAILMRYKEGLQDG